MMASENLSAFLHGKLDLRLKTDPVPLPSKGEVVVRMSQCGICGTDIQMWRSGCVGQEPVSRPVVIGHETSGIVHQVGDDVTQLKVGDRVALELGLPCRRCELCRTGHYNLCKGYSLGGLTRYRAYAADFCHRLPETISMEAGALIEPLAVAVRACRRARVPLGGRVLVCGAGSIGLCVTATALAMGASTICVTDVSTFRLAMAIKIGATHTVLVDTSNGSDARLLASEVKAALGGAADSSIECSGVETSLQAAILATASGGTVSPVALEPEEVVLPIIDAAVREVDIRGVFSYCNDYPAAISLVASGRVDITSIITNQFDLLDIEKAFQLAAERSEGVVKVMVNCS